MRDKEIADIYVEQANNVLDYLENKKSLCEVTTFRGSHAVDVEVLKKRLISVKEKDIPVKKDIKSQTRIIHKKDAKVKYCL
jgi:hypothetical protein